MSYPLLDALLSRVLPKPLDYTAVEFQGFYFPKYMVDRYEASLDKSPADMSKDA